MNTPWRMLVCTAPLMLAGCAMTVREASEPTSAGDTSDFLTDYSKLQLAETDNTIDKLYVAPEAPAHAARYNAVMVDQPELFLHSDSKYKGAKPDDMKVIADALREHVTVELRSGYSIVDQPGENVLYVRLAVSDLRLQKRKRPILAYIPAGAVVYAARNLVVDLTGKVDLTGMKIETEVLDSVSLEQLAAAIVSRSSLDSADDADAAVSWQELNDSFTVMSKRLRCRLDNARLPEAQWQNCPAIEISKAAAPARNR